MGVLCQLMTYTTPSHVTLKSIKVQVSIYCILNMNTTFHKIGIAHLNYRSAYFLSTHVMVW